MIRIAQPEDKDLVLSMVDKFLETTGYKDLSNRAKIEGMIIQFLEAPKEDKIILLFEDYGFLAAMRTQFLYGLQDTAVELAWWVEPSKRGKKAGTALMEAFEFWGKKLNCTVATMCSLDDKVGKFYEKSGYKLYERAYIKGL